MSDGQGTLDILLEFVRDSRGFDFTGYKRSSIERRVSKRMAEVGIEPGAYRDYIEYLELHVEEFVELFNALLINVTAFFRDPQTWEHLTTQILPALLAARPSDSPLRVWCAGCASGEEAYTVAMVLARVLGDADVRERVKIYATDVDDEALDVARLGAYTPRQIEDVPPGALDRFFERTDQRYVFRKDLRRCVIFGRNDLIQDAPISRIDLLVCRNTLMYFTAETQARILRRFHFALGGDGVLLLGKSEMLITHSDLFTPIDLKWRVFKKVVHPVLRDRVRIVAADPENGASVSVTDNLREAAFDVAHGAQVVIDAGGAMVMANETARQMFGLGFGDFGRPIQDLELSYRPIGVLAPLDTLAAERRVIEINAVVWPLGEQDRIVDVRLTPLTSNGTLLGTSISYIDVTESHRLHEQLTTSRKELEAAYEELQATVEELETTNEELQSTNEELETMNEELQSSNEELETMNDELRHRTLELNDLNAFLETILTTIGMAVAVLDRHQHVQIWNAQARELWGLTSEEVDDHHLLSLDIGLPVEQLKESLKAALDGKDGRQELVLDAVNRRGKAFRCRVTTLPLGNPADGGVTGAIMLMEPVDGLTP